MSADKSQIKIKFFTKDEDESLQVSEAPLYVPVSLKRFGLSEVVNHLLETEDKAIPFDFLIDGSLLRTSLDEYLTKNGLSNEAFLNLEYTRAVLPPSFLASFNNDDWVSSLDNINHNSKTVTLLNLSISQPKILSGSYDGIVRTFNMSGAVERQYTGHSGPIRSVKWISPTRIVSAGNDRQVRLWKTSIDKSIVEEDEDEDDIEDGKTLAILEGHKAPVVSLAVEPVTNRILSAGYDNCIGVWSSNYKEMTPIQPLEYDDNVLSTSSKKRRKMALQDASIRRRSPLAMLEGHSQPVEDVIFDSNDSTVAYSVSQDHTIKTWDLVVNRCVDTRSTGYSLLSTIQLPNLNLIVSGSSARHINLHDPRINTTTTEQTNSKLIGHTNFVVGLSASPTNDYMFASASHDGTVKVWDVRADKSLYTITRESKEAVKGQDKVFDVCWDNEIGIISGGQDKKIQINKGSGIEKK